MDTLDRAKAMRSLGRTLESKAHGNPDLTPGMCEDYLRGAVDAYVAAGRAFVEARCARAASRCADNAEACARRITMLHALPPMPEFP